MLIHLVFYIVNISHKCASQLIDIKSILFAICTIAYFTFAPFIREFEFRCDLESNGNTRELKDINLLSGNFMYLLNTFICLYVHAADIVPTFKGHRFFSLKLPFLLLPISARCVAKLHMRHWADFVSRCRADIESNIGPMSGRYKMFAGTM